MDGAFSKEGRKVGKMENKKKKEKKKSKGGWKLVKDVFDDEWDGASE